MDQGRIVATEILFIIAGLIFVAWLAAVGLTIAMVASNQAKSAKISFIPLWAILAISVVAVVLK